MKHSNLIGVGKEAIFSLLKLATNQLLTRIAINNNHNIPKTLLFNRQLQWC
ncbi:MAG: hypothetical protein ACFCAD_21240 [Pleurocapsa sp.]